MAKKLSEILAAAGVSSLDELIDDDTGLPVTEMRKRMTTNQAEYTKATQRAAEQQRIAEERAGQLQQYATALQQWQQRVQQLEAASQGARGTATAVGEDWRNDQYLAPVVAYYDKQLEAAKNTLHMLGTGVARLIQENQVRWQTAEQWADQQEIRRLTQKYSDFDVDKVREAARRHGINSWEGAYVAMQGEGVDERIKTERTKWEAEHEARLKTERDKAVQEATSKLETPVTEMGSGAAPAPPASASDKPKSWGDAWKGLTTELKEAGIGT